MSTSFTSFGKSLFVVNGQLDDSYDACRRLARRRAKNFYYAFLTLPRQQRLGMCALYAFLRVTDDLGDNSAAAEKRRVSLRRWRESLRRALEGTFEDPLLPALVDTINRYQIPVSYLQDVLDGVEMDLEQRRYQTFDELAVYCQRVASAVGLCCLHIWGFHSPQALAPARSLGIAFQLTNILRDVAEDLCEDRIYLPAEDLRRFRFTEQEFRSHPNDARFQALMSFEIDRAKRLYQEASELGRWVDPVGLPSLVVMTRIYRRLLDEIERSCSQVWTHRIRVARWTKLRVVLEAFLGRSTPESFRLAARGS